MTSARQQAVVLLDLLRRERDALAEFLVALARFDRERGWEDLGHASLFAFLVRDLGLSNGAAAYRKAAVHLVQRFPQVLEHLRAGELCITTVFELSKVLTEENASEVLPRFFGASKRDAMDVVAELAPLPAPLRTTVTAVTAAPVPSLGLAAPPDPAGRLADLMRANPTPPAQPGPHQQCNAIQPSPSGTGRAAGEEGNLTPPTRTVVEPKDAALSRMHVTVPRRLVEKLARARDALSHSHPSASDADILELGLDLIVERHRKRRGIGAKPRRKRADGRPEQCGGDAAPRPSAPPSSSISDPPSAPPPPPNPRPKRSRHVPADVWRAVWARDGGRCAWPLDGGGVCGSTFQLEFDHVGGFALGAEATVEGGRVLCRHHQDVAARGLYGDDVMDRYARPKGGRCSEPVAPYGTASTGSSAATRRHGAVSAPAPPACPSARTRRAAPRSREVRARARPLLSPRRAGAPRRATRSPGRSRRGSRRWRGPTGAARSSTSPARATTCTSAAASRRRRSGSGRSATSPPSIRATRGRSGSSGPAAASPASPGPSI